VRVNDRLGRPMLDLRLSVIDACNMRCVYCMPGEQSYSFLREGELLSFEETERLARVFARLGARKIKLTGGEPLLRPWLPELVARLAAIDGIDDLALITNGLLLAGLAAPLRRAGLERVTVSLDSLRDDRFGRMTGRGHRVAQVLRGIDAARREGLAPIKVNAVVIRGWNDDEVLDLARFGRESGCTVRFIEYMDVGNRNGWQPARVVPSAELLALIAARYPLSPVEPQAAGEVAARYRYDDGGGEVGFISSVTQPFCRGCTRARLSADGRLFTCLFASDGLDLRGPLRAGAGDDELLALVRRTWLARDDRYSDERSAAERVAEKKVEMYYIGG
jgi:cyclic pyranopterin phosphate synthase